VVETFHPKVTYLMKFERRQRVVSEHKETGSVYLFGHFPKMYSRGENWEDVSAMFRVNITAP
jgi:hypothetical protein